MHEAKRCSATRASLPQGKNNHFHRALSLNQFRSLYSQGLRATVIQLVAIHKLWSRVHRSEVACQPILISDCSTLPDTLPGAAFKHLGAGYIVDPTVVKLAPRIS